MAKTAARGLGPRPPRRDARAGAALSTAVGPYHRPGRRAQASSLGGVFETEEASMSRPATEQAAKTYYQDEGLPAAWGS